MIASVIIPAFNSEKTIGECIAALNEQEFPKKEFEIIVVDDGSTDNTKKIAEMLGARVFPQKNSGPAKARNNGARKAKGGILVFTDADCMPEKNWIAEMLEPFSDLEVAGAQGAYRTRQKSIVARFAQMEIEERYERMKRFSGKLDWVGSYSAAYRKKDFLEAGGFDESFPKASGEDPELSYRIAKQGKKLVFNPKAIVYHTHPSTLKKYFWSKFWRAYYRVPMYGKHPDKAIRDSYTTTELKLQIAAQYASWLLLAAAAATFAVGDIQAPAFLGALSLLAFAAIPASSARFFLFAAKKDIGAAIAGVLLLIPSRTAAFCLGLPAGLLAGALK